MAGAKHRKTESMKAAAAKTETPNPSNHGEEGHGVDNENAAGGDVGRVAENNALPEPSPPVDVDGEEPDGLAALRREVEAGKDRYLRLMAEFDNYKRRSSKEYERLISAANEKLILEMVDVRENFERALKAGGAGGEFAPFYEGMKLIFSKYDEVLSRNGLAAFAEAGETFDPMIHDALMKAPNAQVPADCIAEVFERGYRLNDKVIKHARVVVSGGSAD